MIIQKMIDIVYPKRCPICDNIISFGKGKICCNCSEKLIFVDEKSCMKCGKVLRDEEREYCEECKKRTHYFDRGMALYPYDVVRESIYRIKYENRREYISFYGEQIAEQFGDFFRGVCADCLIPVPLHKSRLKTRGYNQAYLLAKEIGDRTKIPVHNNYIERCENTVALKGLEVGERQNNLKKAFKICQNDVKLSTIIIIDDIYTTGSTIDAMAKVLKEAGVQKIYFATIAIGQE